MTSLNSLWNWIIANPYLSLLFIGAILSFINGLLPAKVAAGPIGKVLHKALDRLSVLTRTDAPGTLKWPLVGSVLVQTLEQSRVNPPTQESSK